MGNVDGDRVDIKDFDDDGDINVSHDWFLQSNILVKPFFVGISCSTDDQLYKIIKYISF